MKDKPQVSQVTASSLVSCFSALCFLVSSGVSKVFEHMWQVMCDDMSLGMPGRLALFCISLMSFNPKIVGSEFGNVIDGM